MLRKDLKKSQKASLSIEPSICIKLYKEGVTFFWMGSSDLIILPTPKS